MYFTDDVNSQAKDELFSDNFAHCSFSVYYWI